MNKLFEIIYWIAVFLSPLLFFGMIGIGVYLFWENLLWLTIAFVLLGILLGALWAERIRKRKGTGRFMAEIYKTDDMLSYDEIDSEENS